MNARQAAKKWKRKYEEVKNMPVPVMIAEHRDVETMTMKADFYGREAFDEGLVAYKINQMQKELGKEIAVKCGRIETQDDYRRITRTVRLVVKAVRL